MVSFRCRKCGHFEPSGHAAESPQPHACSVCGGGVVFTAEPVKVLAELKAKYPDHNFKEYPVVPGIKKIIDHTNWEILHDATDARLEELGLKREQVEKHLAGPTTERVAKGINVSAHDGVGSTDRAN